MAGGGAAFLTGALGAVLLQFVFGVWVIRAVAQQEYGLISLGYTMANVLVTASTLGFGIAIPHFLGRFLHKDDRNAAGTMMGSALACTLVVGTGCGLAMYAGAAALAGAFGKPEARHTLEVFSLLIPLLALVGVLSAFFRGIEAPRPKVVFEDFGINLLRVLLLLVAVALQAGFDGVLGAYVTSVWLATVGYAFYAARQSRGRLRLSLHWAMTLRLLRFSLPLLGVAFTTQVVAWSGLLSLGYLQTTQELAVFSAPLRLAQLVPFALTAVCFLYLPVASRLIDARSDGRVVDLYRSATKWAFLATLPVLLYILAGAEPLVVSLFGAVYAPAASVLQILAIGAGVHTLLGPNAMTLIAYGETRAVFWATLCAGLTAACVCFALVPPFGAIGAALATGSASVLSNGLISLRLYRRYRVHPFAADYLRPVAFAAGVGMALAWLVLGWAGATSYLAHATLCVALTVLCLSAPVLTGSMGAEDRELLGVLARRIFRARAGHRHGGVGPVAGENNLS